MTPTGSSVWENGERQADYLFIYLLSNSNNDKSDIFFLS